MYNPVGYFVGPPKPALGTLTRLSMYLISKAYILQHIQWLNCGRPCEVSLIMWDLLTKRGTDTYETQSAELASFSTLPSDVTPDSRLTWFGYIPLLVSRDSARI